MSPRGRVRVVAFAVLATVMLVGPAYGQFFAHGRLSNVGWRMYRVRALDLCATDYVLHHPDGTETPIDRFEVLGFTGDREPPFYLWRIDSPDRAYDWGRKICARLGRGADVRLRMKCATEDGWVPKDDGTRTICPQPRRWP